MTNSITIKELFSMQVRCLGCGSRLEATFRRFDDGSMLLLDLEDSSADMCPMCGYEHTDLTIDKWQQEAMELYNDQNLEVATS